MNINFDYNGKKLVLVYNENGVLDYINDIENNKKMMVEYTQIGTGYEMSKNNGFVDMNMCNAVYVRIMELDVFIPKFIFIPNK